MRLGHRLAFPSPASGQWAGSYPLKALKKLRRPQRSQHHEELEEEGDDEVELVQEPRYRGQGNDPEPSRFRFLLNLI